MIVELPDSMPHAKIDRLSLRKVLINLLSNASKFSPAGSCITLRLKADSEAFTVEVMDEGTGILEDEQERIFQPYFRLEQDRQKFHGLGLGLAVARQVVEAHGGTIWVTSKPGCGSSFFFTIPVETTKQS
jgi:two-component system sensor histidine kinase VicK